MSRTTKPPIQKLPTIIHLRSPDPQFPFSSVPPSCSLAASSSPLSRSSFFLHTSHHPPHPIPSRSHFVLRIVATTMLSFISALPPLLRSTRNQSKPFLIALQNPPLPHPSMQTSSLIASQPHALKPPKLNTTRPYPTLYTPYAVR